MQELQHHELSILASLDLMNYKNFQKEKLFVTTLKRIGRKGIPSYRKFSK